MPPEFYIGLMSGTSLDGVDGVLAQISDSKCAVAQHVSAPFAPELRAELLALNASGPDELHRAALAANRLARAYAGVVHELLRSLPPSAPSNGNTIRAIGAHGQTVRHRPLAFDGIGYTLQLNNPALLAELTGLTVVANFRSRDVAAGGQGAPLVPAFHQGVFGQPGQTVAVLNLGGISNLSVLHANGTVQGWDCGPGNALMDYWCHLHTGQLYDAGGTWAASGQVIDSLLHTLLREPFLAESPPKSTGRDLFNPDWLQRLLGEFSAADPAAVQATLTDFTAASCAQDVARLAPACRLLIVCGGGAFNAHLLRRLQARLPGVSVKSSEGHGLPPLQVEAAAFAWLARQAVHGATASLPAVTGARGPRVLGAIYPA